LRRKKLPLKDVDVKTFEAYKKAMRLETPKITPGGKTKFWIYRDVELPNVSGKKQKIVSFLALVDDRAIKPILKGKKLICRGTCGLLEDKVAFQAESGKVPYLQLKTSVPLFLGKQVHIPSNANEDAEDEDAEAEGEAEDESQKAGGIAGNGAQPSADATEQPAPAIPPPPPPPPAAPGLAAAWNKLVKDLQAAVAAHPERKDALSRAAAGIPELIKTNQAAEAQQRMDALQAMLSAPPPAPPPPPVPTPGAPGLAAAWNKLVKDLQATAAAHPERRDALSRAAAGIPDLIKANQAEAARQKMAAVQELLDSVSAPAPSGPPSSGELRVRWNALVKQMQAEVAAHPEKKADIARASTGIPDMILAGKLELAKKSMDNVDAVLKASPREKEYRDLYAKLESQLALALKDPAQDASRLRAISAVAVEKAEVGDYDTALKALQQLQEVLGSAAQAPAAGGKAEAFGEAEFRKQWPAAKDAWQAALASVDGQIKHLQSILKSSDDTELREIAEFGLNGVTGNFKVRMMAVLHDIEGAHGDKLAADARRAAQIAAGFLKHIDTAMTVKACDENPFGVQVSIRKTLGGALAHLKDALKIANPA
jgi:hypothetical protein